MSIRLLAGGDQALLCRVLYFYVNAVMRPFHPLQARTFTMGNLVHYYCGLGVGIFGESKIGGISAFGMV